MALSTPVSLGSFAPGVAEQLGAQRTEQDGTPDRVRIIFADGRTLELSPNRPRTRITITVVLPEQAAARDLTIEPITVTAQPRSRPSETQDKATALHTADHIRRRLVRQQTAVVSLLSAAVERARSALSALPGRPERRWAVSDLPVAHPLGLDQWCPIVWWHTPAGASRAVTPFLAAVLRRAGLVTTEPHGSAHAFFAEPPTEQPEARFHVAPASGRAGWDLVDQLTGASVHTYDDAEWAQGDAESASREYETARARRHPVAGSARSVGRADRGGASARPGCRVGPVRAHALRPDRRRLHADGWVPHLPRPASRCCAGGAAAEPWGRSGPEPASRRPSARSSATTRTWRPTHSS